MNFYTPALAPRLDGVLAQREDELRAILSEHADDGSDHEVTDFKDLAVRQTQFVVDEARTEHAQAELREIVAARRRLADGSYGQCLGCQGAIDLRRLEALPATPLCADCQGTQEREHGSGPRPVLRLRPGKPA